MAEIGHDASRRDAPSVLAETIAKFWKSARDRSKHVRVDLSEYEGHKLVNIRVWQAGDDGIDRPSKHGIALAIHKLPQLRAALVKAEARARELGILADDGGGQ